MQWSIRYTLAKVVQCADVHQAFLRKQMEKFAQTEIPTAVQSTEIATRLTAAVTKGAPTLHSMHLDHPYVHLHICEC